MRGGNGYTLAETERTEQDDQENRGGGSDERGDVCRGLVVSVALPFRPPSPDCRLAREWRF
jgi:hypothetical protein